MTTGLVIAGRYRLLSKLGQGGMGAVWRAEHLTLGTHIAIKLIDLSIAESDEALGRFRREAQAAAELRSTHVVHILDYGVEDGRPYIAMELLDGESLAQRLARFKRLAPDEVADVLTQVGRALTKAHQRNIVHRDLKPDNIYLVRDGDEEIAKVLDFGIAKKLGLSAASGGVKTQTGAMLGTPYYMSPEQARAQANIDHRTDIWSLGVIAYECLTGARPFDGDTLTSLLISICTGTIPVPSSVADVPVGFDTWFARATDRNADQRFQSVSEAIAELRRVLGEDARVKQRAAISSAASGHAASTSAELERTVEPSALTIGSIPKRSSWVALLIGVGVISLIGLGIGAARLLARAPTETSQDAPVASEPNPVSAQTMVPAIKTPAAAVASASASAAPISSMVVPASATATRLGADSVAAPSAAPSVAVGVAPRVRRAVSTGSKSMAPPANTHAEAAPAAVTPAAPVPPVPSAVPANSSTQPAPPNYYKSVGF